LCVLGVDDFDREEVLIMADRGRGRGRGNSGRGDRQQQQNQQFQPDFNQMQAFPYHRQAPYGFMPGAMPPPWFGGPLPPYPQQPYGVQPNQWVNRQGQQAAGDYGGRNKNQQGRL
jgi:hypothetical protein